MFAAHAAVMHGHEVVIISKKQKSKIYGAQYLHRRIPGLSDKLPAGFITTMRCGTAGRYAERVYGDVNKVTSWSRVQPRVPAWDLRKTYDRAWMQFEDRIVDSYLDADDVNNFLLNFELVISTVPLWTICAKPGEHNFESVSILVRQSLPPEITPVMSDDNWVIYNGMDNDSKWYRASHIFGSWSTEAISEKSTLPLIGEEWQAGFKVVRNNCNCHQQLVRAGRMGLWKSGILTHHAFERAVESISERFSTQV